MYMGAAEDEGRNADPAVAMAKMQLAKAAGFDTIRITAIWEPGQSAVPAGQLAALQAIAAAGDFLGIRIVTTRDELRQPNDAADRRGTHPVRPLRRRHRQACSQHPRVHRGERAEPEPLLAPPVRTERRGRRCHCLRTAARAHVRRDESRGQRRLHHRRLGLPARDRQARHRTRHALPDGLHHRHGNCLSRPEAQPADHGRLLLPPIRRELEHAADVRPCSRYVPRPGRLRQARRPARKCIRRHEAAGLAAADRLRRVRRRLPDPRPASGPSTAARNRPRRNRSARACRPRTTARRSSWPPVSPRCAAS